MRGREIERQLQVNEPEILAATAAERGAEPIEHFGGARLRRVHHHGQLLSRLELVDGLDDQRMARQGFVERGKYLQRVSCVSLSREKTPVSLHHAQRRRIELVGVFSRDRETQLTR